MKTSSKTRRWLAGAVAGILAGVAAGAAAPRTWTDATTGVAIEAEFAGLAGGTVKLKLANGRIGEVPLARLSLPDQDFVKGAAAGKGAAGGADWPTWRGADRSDRSPDTGLLAKWPPAGPDLQWTFTGAGKGYSSPIIVAGRLYFTGSRDGDAEIICLDARDGKELWSTKIGDDPEKGYNTGWGGGPRGAPTFSEGLVYAMSANGDLACVNAADGARKWTKSLVEDFGGKVPGWGYSESPLVDGGKLIVTPGGKEGAMVALDKKTGRKIWQSGDLTDGAQYSSVIAAGVGGKRHYVQLFMKTLAGVDAEDGEVLWTVEWPQGRTAVIPTPIYHDGHVYMTSGYGAGCQLIRIAGGGAEVVYKNKTMKNHHGGVVLVDGHLYGFSDAMGLVCQEFMTGERKWNEKGEGKQKGAVHYADGMLYCLNEQDGSVFLVEASPDGYKEKGRFPLPKKTKLREGTNGKVWTHPVVIGGRLYLRDQDLLWCYDVKAP